MRKRPPGVSTEVGALLPIDPQPPKFFTHCDYVGYKDELFLVCLLNRNNCLIVGVVEYSLAGVIVTLYPTVEVEVDLLVDTQWGFH